jgi:adenosylmethionine---8-amino-7-oxononanoate aminotransferase
MNWLERDAAAVWHPFTQHSLWQGDEPSVVDRAEGPWLYDVAGNRLLDGVSSLWVTTFGHGTPEINDAIKAQLDRLDHATFLGATHVPGIELAERLLASAPGTREAKDPTVPPPDPDQPSGPSPTDPEGPTDPKPTEPTEPTGPDEPPATARLSKVFYAGDGSSAVEVALKMAYQHSVQAGGGTGRPLFLHLQEAYHGDTLGAVSVGGIELFHATYRPLLLKTVTVGSPGVRKPGQPATERAVEAVDEMADAMARYGDQVCALVVEPMVQAAAGILTYDAHFLRAARSLATRYGALLICDEVATGIGRTGTMWACEQFGLKPDIMTIGKGIGGGFPLSAVASSFGRMSAKPFGEPSGSSSSYGGNPLAAAAGLGAVEAILEEKLVENSARIGALMLDGLKALQEKYRFIGDVRGRGLMIGVEMVADRTTKEPLDKTITRALFHEALERGLITMSYSHVIRLNPPLVISEDEAMCGIDILDESFAAIARKFGLD